MTSFLLLGALALAPSGDVKTDDALDRGAPVVPATRNDLKNALEASKRNQPRLPLPPLTEEEKQKAGDGDWSIVNNGRMRRHYLPQAAINGGFLRQPDPAMTLGYPFQTMLFWIISRGNNCTYCMGHQETKLASVGLSDDQIAALDADWAIYTPAERAAFAFVKKSTFTPHEIDAADLESLREHYTDDQILEIVFVCGNFNAMNRWTGALRIPQEDHREYLTPTSEKYKNLASAVAPLPENGSSSPSAAPPAKRPALESREQVASALEAARHRKPHIPLVEEPKARETLAEVLPNSASDKPLPSWVRLLARFPVAGANRVTMIQGAIEEGQLPAEWKPQIAWVAARNDRAWYALAHAGQRLRDLGWSDDQIFALDNPDSATSPAQRAVLSLARKLTVDPARITDADIEDLRAHFNDHQVAEIVHHVTESAFFNRVTEAANLPLEPGVFTHQ